MTSSNATYDELIAFAAGDLAGADAERVQRCVASDPSAAATVVRFRLAARSMAGDDSTPPPAATVDRARAIFRVQPKTTASWLERIDTLVAQLVFDSRAQPALVRSAATADRIQLAFETDGLDVDLVAERDDERGPWRLMGQVAHTQPVDGIAVALTAAGSTTPVAETVTDEHGAFTLEARPGTYDLCLKSRTTVVLPDIRLE